MKKVILSLAISFISFAAFSQERQQGSELSIGLEGGLPLNGWSAGGQKLYSFGIGGSLKYAYNFDESVAATLQAGYINFMAKTVTVDGETGKYPAIGQIPIKAGIRFSMGQFYAEPQLGMSIFTASGGGSSTAFTYAGNIGVLASKNFDVSLRYEGWSKDGNAGFLGLRLAYVFPLAK